MCYVEILLQGVLFVKDLFDLVLRLPKLDMFVLVQLFIICLSGEKMKTQGTDGLSQEALIDGVMRRGYAVFCSP